MGVRLVRGPNGDVWWVKRAWVPRYRGLRDRVGDYLDARPRRWYQAPLRVYARGYDRWVPEDAVSSGSSLPWPAPPADPTGAAAYPIQDAADVSPDMAHALGLDLGGGGDLGSPPGPTQAGLLDLGGGGDLTGGAVAGADGSALTADLGGGGDLGSGAAGGGGGGGGGGDGGGGGGDDWGDLGVLILVALAVVALLVVVGWVLLPLLMAVVDGAVLLIAILAAGAVRVLLRRPWDVVATQDLPDGLQQVRRWELRGYRRAGRARDDVTRALETGTDADLAVARVVVRDPVPGDPAGIARSERELHWR